jgi:Fur family ferric uptake transcriptional regulator
MSPRSAAKSKEMEAFRRHLQACGLRLTRDRRAIVEQIFAMHEHFTIDDLFVELHLQGVRLSKTTLYRNLPLLIESGLIRRVPDESTNARYEHVLGHPHHDHLICLGCRREIEFSSDQIETAQDEVCQEFEFQPVRHRLGIWGYCQDCRQGEKKEGNPPAQPVKRRSRQKRPPS